MNIPESDQALERIYQSLTAQPGQEQERAASSIPPAGELGELAVDGGIWAFTRNSSTAAISAVCEVVAGIIGGIFDGF